MTTFNHAFSFSFEVPGSIDPEGKDVTPGQMREALLKRLSAIGDEELMEAVGAPFDSFEEEV